MILFELLRNYETQTGRKEAYSEIELDQKEIVCSSYHCVIYLQITFFVQRAHAASLCHFSAVVVSAEAGGSNACESPRTPFGEQHWETMPIAEGRA